MSGKDGRIGDRETLKRVADALQMEGVNRMPMQLNRDQVQPVIDIGRFLNPSSPSVFTPNIQENLNDVSLVGSSNFTFNYLNNAAASPTPIIANDNLDTRVTTFAFELSFTAAGALAFNGKAINVFAWLEDKTLNTFSYIYMLRPWITVATAFTVYDFAFPSAFTQQGGRQYNPTWNGYVPKQWALKMNLTVDDGTAFPAGTSLNKFIGGLQVSPGSLLPN